jgi:pectin methylesterase-like acyl-CoA thioesterase
MTRRYAPHATGSTGVLTRRCGPRYGRVEVSAFLLPEAIVRRRALLGFAAGLGAAALAGRGAPAQAWPGPYLTVAADGSGDHTTIQAAVDAVPAGNSARFTIKIKPGVYAGQVIIPRD